jgi:Flp pilus assembly protein TadD
MGARRFTGGVLLAMMAGCAVGSGQAAPQAPPLPANNQPTQTDSGATGVTPDGSTPGSTTKVIHRRTGPNSSETIRHTRVLDEGSAQPELARAEELIQKKDYAAAEPLLRKVVENAAGDDGSRYVEWFDLAFVENELGKTDESIAAYRKSVAAKPNVFESNLNLGLQLAKTHQPDAEQFLRAATQLKPTSHVAEGQARAWLSLGHVIATDKPDDAIAAYREAAVLQPKDPEPHFEAGLILEKQKKSADAIQEYKQALALDPSSAEALTGLANLYMDGRQFPEAEASLRKLAATHGDQAAVRIQLGRVLAAQDKNDEAITELQAGAKLAPDDATVPPELAELYTKTGKNSLAEAAYRGLLATHPNDAELHRGLGQSLLRQKKFPAAEQEFVAAVKIKPDLGEAYGDLAFAAGENKEYPLTVKALDARAKFLPETAITYFMRASAYDHLKDFKQASVNYHLFLKNANGKYPDQEWQATHRLIAIEPKK